MQEIRLVALDIDGTILDSSSRLHPVTIDTIKRVQEKGILVTLATGRTYSSTCLIASQLGIAMPLVTYNGSYIRGIGQEPMVSKPLEMEHIHPVIELLEQQRCYIKVYIDDHLYVQEKAEETLRFSAIHQVPFTEVGSGNLSKLQGDPMKVVVYDSPERITALLQMLEPWLDQFHFCREIDTFEINYKGTDKSKGLLTLCEHLGISMEHVMAFGNESNDLEMIEAAGIGIAVGNASKVLSEAADLVVKSNDELGVAETLERYFLSKIDDTAM